MSKNIREELVKIKEMNLHDSSNAIANQLIIDYDNNSFSSQKELANKSFTSESMVTYFSKKLGFSGYRELCAALKMQNEFYDISKPINIGEDGDFLISFKKDFNETLLSIDSQYESIKKIINYINKSKRIFIFSSYEQLNNSETLFNILQLQGKNVYFSRYIKSKGYYASEITKDDFALFIVTGLDNQSIVNYYDKVKAKNINTGVIASASQNKKFVNPNVSIVIQSSNKSEIYQTARNAHFNYLFNIILLKIK